MSKKEFIKAADVVNLKSWSLPTVKGSIINDNFRDAHQERLTGRKNAENKLTAEQLQSIRKKAYQEGFQQGVDEGKASFKHQSQLVIEQFVDVIKALKKPMEIVDESVQQQLMKLCLLVSKQVIAFEVTSSQECILKAIQDSLSLLPQSDSLIKIRLNPEDINIVKRVYAQQLSVDPDGWKLIEDATISQGGCFVNAKASTIDATIEHKIEQLTHTLLSRVKDNGEH